MKNRFTLSYLLFFALLFPSLTEAQTSITTAGKEFWLGFMTNAVAAGGTAPDLRVQITSDFVTSGTITQPGGGFNQPFNVFPGAPTTISFPPATFMHPGTGTAPIGIKIVSNDPISVSAESVEPASTDAARLLPRKAIRDEYYVTTYDNTAVNTQAEFLIIATEDGTTVEITPTVGTLTGNPAGVPFTVNLDEGDSYQVQANGDLAGSFVRSLDPCKAIAVFGGSSCQSVPIGGGCCCDHLYEQMVPIVGWGNEYYTTGFRAQERIRILAAQNGTNVTINGVPIPVVLNQGQFHEFNSGTPPTPSYITSDKPISVTQFAPSGDAASNVGDPFQSRAFSMEQGIDTIVFATIVGVNNNHNVAIIAYTADVPNITLDGANISASFNVHPQNPALSYANHFISFSSVATSHTLAGPGKMVAMIHGYGPDDSYAFSGGGFVNNLAIDLNFPDTVCMDSLVAFDEEISYTYHRLTYDFGDGDTSDQSDPTHTFTTPGTYTVTLSVVQLPCIDPDVITRDIVVQAPVTPGVIIGDTPLCPSSIGQYELVGASGSSKISYTWDFDGGNVTSGSDAGPYTVSWPDTGTYEIVVSYSDPLSRCLLPDPDTFIVEVRNPLQADAGMDFAICQTNGNFAANPTPNATGLWTPGPGMIINNPNNPNAPFALTNGPGNYVAYWSEDSLGCTSLDSVQVSYTPLAIPEAGPDEVSCDGTGTLSATSLSGLGQWNEPSGNVNFNTPTFENTDFTGPPGNYLVYWCDNTPEGCTSCDSLNLIIYDEIQAFAGNDTATCGEFMQLQGSTTPTTSGTWTTNRPNVNIFNGAPGQVFVQVNNVQAPFEAIEFYYDQTNGSCNDTDTVVVTFYDLPAPEAGPNDSVCGLSYQLQATPTLGSGKWTVLDSSGNVVTPTFNPHDSANDPVVTMTPVYGEYTFYWTVDQGVCNSADSVKITFLETPISDAGLNDTICSLCYTLAANASVGTGTWTSNVTATFSNANDPNAQACITSFGDAEFYWTEVNGACTDSDTVMVNFFESAALTIIPDSGAFCGSSGSVQATMNKPNQPGFWSTQAADLSFGNANDSLTTVSKSNPGCAWVYYTIDYGACQVVDSAQLCFFDPPTTFAGDDDTVCGTIATLNATPSLGVGTWIDPTGNLLFTANDPNSTLDLNGQPYGNYLMIWEEVNGACSDRDSVQIEFVQQPLAQAGVDTTICDSALTLAASPSVGLGTWTSDPSGVTFSNPNSDTATANFGGLPYGHYELIWTEQNQICSDADTILVNFLQEPQAFAGLDDSVCGPSYVLQGAYSTPSQTGSWTSFPAGVSIAGNDPNATASIPSGQYGTYTLIWTETNGQCSDSDTISLTFIEQPVADAGPDATVCALVTNLASSPSVSGSNGNWSSIPAGATFSPVNSPFAQVTVPSYGVYQFVWEETNVVCVSRDTVEVTFTEQPNIPVIPNDSICGSQLTKVFQHSAQGSTFTLSTTAGGVNINPVTDSSFSISVGSNYGCHQFTLTETNGNCTDTETLTLCFYEVPVAFAGLDAEICGLEYTLNATPASGTGYWTGPAGTQMSNPNGATNTVNVFQLSFGTYPFVYTDSNAVCLDRDTVFITFYDNPEITCNCDQDTIYTTDPYYTFIDSTERAVTWFWDFGDGSTSTEQSPVHGYGETGVFEVSLTVTDQFGCQSTHTCTIELIEDLRLFVPNAFTPDDDGINDGFKASILGHIPGSYTMEIYDRWGKRIFETDDQNEYWTGINKITGVMAKPDVYAVKIKYETYGGLTRTYRGMVVLVN